MIKENDIIFDDVFKCWRSKKDIKNDKILMNINNKYGTNFTKLKGFFNGINFTKYLLNNHLLIVNNKTKKEIFYKLNR